MRAEWNLDIKLDDWQAKYGEDKGSRATNFSYAVTGDTFQITDPQAGAKRSITTLLPVGSVWKPTDPKMVGSSITAWPTANL